MTNLDTGSFPTRVLVVDDEMNVRSALARALTLTGYIADEAASGRQALQMLEYVSYDAMVLDIQMPGIDGIEVMSRACRLYPNLCIIILTGYATLESAITAIKSNAADYLLKPVSVHDVVAAITNALQQRVQKGSARTLPPERFLRTGSITLNRERRLVIIAGNDDADSRRVKLTASESALLVHLMQRPNTIFSCRELAQATLGYDVSEGEARSIIRPHISRLRKKIESEADSLCLIHNVPGGGYFFTR